MRVKIIAIFSVIILLVCGVIYGVGVATMGKQPDKREKDTPRALQGAITQLQVEGLATERWLTGRVAEASAREPFVAGTANARAEGATTVANKIRDAAASAPELLGVQPSIVLLVDTAGVVLGRNGSTLMRGDDLTKVYTGLKAAIDSGTPISDVWVNRTRNEQLLASFVPVRGDDGKLLGGVVYGTSLNDERLSNASDKTSGHALLLAVKGEHGIDIVAKSSSVDPSMAAVAMKAPASDAILKTLTTGEALDVPGFGSGVSALVRPMDGYGDGKRAVVVAIVQPPSTSVASALALPIFGAAILGLFLVVLAGVLLDAYISRPIAEIEDGLLGIMNGQTNRRFEIEHAELGGLVFRLNSLLNQLFQITEDDTDAEGRPSRPASTQEFSEAVGVDRQQSESGDKS